MASKFGGVPIDDVQTSESRFGGVPIDAPVTAPTQNPIAQIGASQLGQAVGGVIDETGNIIKNIPNQNPASSGLQLVGHGAKIIGAPVAAAISALTPDIAKQGAQAVASGVDSVAPSIGDSLLKVKELMQAHPEMAANLSAAGNIAGTLYGGSKATALAPDVAKTIKPSNLAGDVSSGVSTNAALAGIPNIVPKKYTPQYDQLAGQKAMAETYMQNKKTAGSLYDATQALAVGKPIDARGLAQNVQGIIDDIQADPFHEARGALPKLQKTLDKLNSSIPETVGKSADGEIPMQGSAPVTKFDLADALDLKKTMNEAFNGTRWSQNAKGTVYGDLGSKVGAIISDASQKYPEFGAANDLSHKYWLNNVNNAFQDNAIMAKYFKPDDLREFQSLADGKTVALHDETIQRAMQTLKNIKTPTELDAVRRALPPQLADALSQDIIKAQGASGRMGALGKTVAGILDVRPHGIARTVNNVADVIGGVPKTPEQIALITAAKSPAPRFLTPEQLKAKATADFAAKKAAARKNP
jgi:hypothetical protein